VAEAAGGWQEQQVELVEGIELDDKKYLYGSRTPEAM